MKKDLSLFARRLREARKKAHISQLELGEKVGVSDKSISAYEQGRAEPPFQKLKKIAELTNQSITFFTEQNTSSSDLEAKIAVLEKELAEVKEMLKAKA
jgi:transcriptional regulator with XRE-family HTH domain